MFHYRNTFVQNSTGVLLYQPRSLVSGININYSDVSTDGESGVIAVTFYPVGAACFLPFPLYEIEDRSVALADIFYSKIKDIEEQICLAQTNATRIKIIEKFLTSCFNPAKSNEYQAIKKGINLLKLSGGQISSSKLSEELFISTKTLERKFAAYVGKTPKQFIRIVRFQRIIGLLSQTKITSLSQLALDNGYFDQAHFTNDFREMSGYTPKEFLALGPCNSDFSG